MSAHIPIAIIGAGIAGFSAAIALARKGHGVRLYETRRDGLEVGAGIQISPNASHVLFRWGLGAALSAVAVLPQALRIRRWPGGARVGEMPLEGYDTGDGAPFLLLRRADLHAILKSAALDYPDVTLEEGWTLESLRQEGGLTALHFQTSEGLQTVRARCVLGCDGQRSRMRQLAGDSRDLSSSGYEAWRTLVPANRAPESARAPLTDLWLADDAHAVHYPVAAGDLINLVLILKSTRTGEGWQRAGDRRGLDPVIQKAPSPLRDLIEAAPEWTVWTLRDRWPSPCLSKGCLALLGDAGHPVLPFLAQGAALAIEDAAVLAHELPSPQSFERTGIEAGLARYAAARGARVTRVYKAARSNARVYHLPAPLAALRDWRIGSLGADGMRQRYAWLYDWRAP